MVRCVRCFYQWLDPTLWEGSALFELWAQELELIYGDLRQRLSLSRFELRFALRLAVHDHQLHHQLPLGI